MSHQPRPDRDTGGSAISLLVSQERAYSLSVKEGWFEMVDASTRKQPPAKTTKQLAAMSDDERLRYNELRAVWHANLGPIQTPQLRQVHEDLWEIVDSNRQDGDRVKGAASIDAHPGLGKTTIAVAFGREFHRRQIELCRQRFRRWTRIVRGEVRRLTGSCSVSIEQPVVKHYPAWSRPARSGGVCHRRA